MRTKSDWRRELRARRRAVDRDAAQAAAQRTASHLTASPIWRQTEHIALYFSADGELPTVAIAAAARRDNKQLYLPVVAGNTLQFRAWRGDGALVANRYGIEEPGPQAAPAPHLDLILLPLVGFTGTGFRLGMGGGFYDRYLADPTPGAASRHDPPSPSPAPSPSQVSTVAVAEPPRGLRIGLAYACQQEDELDTLREPFDQGLDAVLTELGLTIMKN